MIAQNFKMLPDEPFAPSPTTQLRSFSVQHLLWQNLEARLSPRELAEALLATYRAASPKWPLRDYVRALCARVVRRFELSGFDLACGDTRLDVLSDRALVRLAVKFGQGLGAGAPWGVSREAGLLWAAAAALTKFHGCEHPNEISDGPEPA
jgi:hypothetical protein